MFVYKRFIFHDFLSKPVLANLFLFCEFSINDIITIVVVLIIVVVAVLVHCSRSSLGSFF
ncbi:hypothetical protein EVA_11204 [gut metagenome]|uniref:Uncharacterized protein n=1 Tax=gut metagenome TaxID=749906 RepID=J9GLP3_9ZZZZ